MLVTFVGDVEVSPACYAWPEGLLSAARANETLLAEMASQGTDQVLDAIELLCRSMPHDMLVEQRLRGAG